MDLKDQLQKLFPDHEMEEGNDDNAVDNVKKILKQSEPLICKYEKRKGKPVTLIEGFEGPLDQMKALASQLKKKLSVGGGCKGDVIVIQGDYRSQIMQYLNEIGYKTKRVGG